MTFIDALEKLEKGEDSAGRAAAIGFLYGGYDGAHHKMWVIDQMLRALTGAAYSKSVALYENNGEYAWDIGIAP